MERTPGLEKIPRRHSKRERRVFEETGLLPALGRKGARRKEKARARMVPWRGTPILVACGASRRQPKLTHVDES